MSLNPVYRVQHSIWNHQHQLRNGSTDFLPLRNGVTLIADCVARVAPQSSLHFFGVCYENIYVRFWLRKKILSENPVAFSDRMNPILYCRYGRWLNTLGHQGPTERGDTTSWRMALKFFA